MLSIAKMSETVARQSFELSTRGFTIINGILSNPQVDRVSEELSQLNGKAARTRRLLSQTWCADLARILKTDAAIAPLLPSEAVAVQATYFPKTEADNWKVALHRDYFVPVKSSVDAPGWGSWSRKEHVVFVRPPDEFLQRLVAVRVHLEECDNANGPLVVVAGSHKAHISSPRTRCLVKAGGALVMNPLTLHASSKLQSGTRRVLHLLFGPRTLPHGLEWAYAV